MRFVFLDFDGVLAPIKTDGHEVTDYVCTDWLKPCGCIGFDPDCVAELNLICDTGRASIVVCSSWRNAIPDLENMRRMLIEQGVNAPVTGMTPRWNEHLQIDWTRGSEVGYFLEPLDVESFVILDDCDMGWSGMENRWVKTNAWRGICRKDSKKAIEILNTLCPKQ